MKNYYQILNIKQTATEDEIKRSYRVLAKKYHPDVNPGDARAADRFADINEAHDTLSDPAKRAEYDKKLAAANAPKPSPEEIIARQRAQAQAAARQAAARQAAAAQQAAMRNTIRENLRSSSDPSVILAQRAAAQAAAAQAVAAQAQAQAQQYQAQLTAVERKAHEKGVADGKRIAQVDIDRLNAEVKSLKAENARLRDKLAETESDRSELEQELFDRDREFNEQKQRAAELEERLNDAERMQAQPQPQAASRRGGKVTTRDYDELNAQIGSLNAIIERLTERTKQMEAERNQAELKARAQLELQQEKRRELVDHIEELNAEIRALNEEVENLRADNERWEQYAKSEDFLTAAERKMEEWERKQKADKKLARSTLYGALGVLIWATDDEINVAYDKLEKRYSSKTDDVSAEKLAALKSAYAVLSDPAKRAEYNASIGIDEERIGAERALAEENAALEEEYRSKLEDKEFWARFDELSFNAQAGDADAQNRLGEMYYYGDEIEKDIEQAVYWFKESAKQKHADGIYNLGVCFVNGEGMDKNAATGMGFIRQAAKLGSAAAKQYLDNNG